MVGVVSSTPQVVGAHLVGSVPLISSVEVMKRATNELPGRLRRIPDGEPGERNMFVAFQVQKLPEATRFNSQAKIDEAALKTRPFTLKDFQPLGYAKAAQESYKTFSALREQGVIPHGVRFQVGLPTPLSAMTAAKAGYQHLVEAQYEQLLFAEIDAIAHAIPIEDLAIQWDMAIETGYLEIASGNTDVKPWLPRPWFPDIRDNVHKRALRCINAVPAGG
ncbi:hypothetical protein MRB53_037589 [Persea americana]|nr:hypothetical protein MRB53_037589 [Persea americana]